MNLRGTPQSETPEDLGDFEFLYKKYYGLVAATVRKFRLGDASADDIIQDTFVQAWQNLSSLKDPKAFRGWLLTIARNNCLMVIKKTKPTVSVTGTDQSPDEDSKGQDIVLIADDNDILAFAIFIGALVGSCEDSKGQDIVLIADDIQATIHFEQSITLLTQLIESHEGEPRATIARMFYLQKQSVKSISETLKLKQNTVLSHLRRFRLIISKAMVELVENKGIEIS